MSDKFALQDWIWVDGTFYHLAYNVDGNDTERYLDGAKVDGQFRIPAKKVKPEELILKLKVDVEMRVNGELVDLSE